MSDNKTHFQGLGAFTNIETECISAIRREINQELIQWEYSNGYGGSLACNDLTYGIPEFGVLKNGKLHYKTDITKDVMRPVSPTEVQTYLNKIKEL